MDFKHSLLRSYFFSPRTWAFVSWSWRLIFLWHSKVSYVYIEGTLKRRRHTLTRHYTKETKLCNWDHISKFIQPTFQSPLVYTQCIYLLEEQLCTQVINDIQKKNCFLTLISLHVDPWCLLAWDFLTDFFLCCIYLSFEDNCWKSLAVSFSLCFWRPNESSDYFQCIHPGLVLIRAVQ